MKTDKTQPLLPYRRRFLEILLFAAACFMPVVHSIGWGAEGKDNPELQQVYRQMEAAGKGFRSFHAKISKKQYTAVLKEFGTVETGEFYMARAKDRSTMMRQDITSPARVILTIKGELITIYRPTIKEAQIHNLGKSRENSAEYLALGIGQPPAELQKNYDISYQGEESVGGSPCALLNLKPKNPKTSNLYALIVWWVKKSSGIPIQIKLQETNNDFLLVTFSDEKINPNIPDSKFEQKLPAGVEIQRF
ncbi:MAG: sigma-E factor regulatory protein RseB domain-containing protein [Acidobacteriota bacterium]